MQGAQLLLSVFQAVGLSPHVGQSAYFESNVRGVEFQDIEDLVVAGRAVSNRMNHRQRELALGQIFAEALGRGHLIVVVSSIGQGDDVHIPAQSKDSGGRHGLERSDPLDLPSAGCCVLWS